MIGGALFRSAASVLAQLAAAGGAALVGFLQAGAGTAARTAQDKLREVLAITDFAADGVSGARVDPTGVIDSTAGIQAAIVAAETTGRAVHAPAGTYLITAALVITKGITFRGDGIASTVFRVGALGAGIDVIRIVPGAPLMGLLLEGFRLAPAAGTPARHGISIDIGTHPVYNSTIRNVRVDQFGGRGIATLPNAVPLIDGFFLSTIESCVVYGGVYLDKAGDSLHILRSNILGTNVSIYADLVGVTGSDGGAHGLEIIGNNLTGAGGWLYVKNAWAGRFLGNNCEVPAPGVIADNAALNIAGESALYPTNNFVVAGNFLGAPAGIDAVRLNHTRRCVVRDNYVARGLGAMSYRITANALDNAILNNCDALDEAIATLLDDAGTRTVWEREFGGYFETRADMWFQSANKKIYFTDSAGNKRPVVSADAIDDVVRVGYQSAPATNGHLLLFAGGTEGARINADGRVAVGSSGDLSAILSVASTTQGFLLPQMTTAQKNAIAAPAPGLMVFDLTLSKACVCVGGAWQTITSA